MIRFLCFLMTFLAILTHSPDLFAGKAAIFSGNDIRILKPSLDFFGRAKILTGTQDPSITATDALQGSLFLRTGTFGGTVFSKQDNGLTTNWLLLNAPAGGSLIVNEFSNPSGLGTLLGARNSSNKAYTINHVPTAGGLFNVMIDGVMLDPNDWSFGGGIITIGAAIPAPAIFQTVSVNYEYGTLTSNAIAEFSNPSGGTLTGARNGSNKVFGISNTPLVGGLFNVLIDGAMLDPNDWSLAGTTVTLGAGVSAPAVFQSVVVNYQY